MKVLCARHVGRVYTAPHVPKLHSSTEVLWYSFIVTKHESDGTRAISASEALEREQLVAMATTPGPTPLAPYPPLATY
jgi:hypothetical protein